MQSQGRKFRRTANACIPCRQSKIKCSGEEPCANCQRRFVNCRFEEGGNKITVPERYLRELQRKVREQSSLNAPKPESAGRATTAGESEAPDASGLRFSDLPPLSGIDDGRSIWTSPFTQPSTTTRSIYKQKRNWIWLAPSSAWSFTARLTILMTDKLKLSSVSNSPIFLTDDIYDIKWSPIQAGAAIDISGLPSLDYALYLVNTVKFHLGPTYRCFDDKTFQQHMKEFYFGDPAKKAAEQRLWFVQFLMVLAFGKAFLSQSLSTDEPPGAKFFLRAMSILPDITMLWKDGLLAIEVLAMAGLYLYCIDRRESAHVYIGQAIRIAHMEGLHTELPVDELGIETVTRCRNLWWTLYIMDRYFSSSLGVPMTTQDSDISTVLEPTNATSQGQSCLGIQVNLSRLLSYILTNIYRTEKAHLGTFLETIRSILHSMAGHAQEIESIFELNFKNSVDTMSKETRHITLLYHQCVIVATRPVLLSVLRERLEKLNSGEEDWQTFLALTKPLITAGIKSAVKTLQILSSEDSLLEIFLPFDLEFTFGAAVYLTMAKSLFRHTDDVESCSEQTHAILKIMISRGNKIAQMRQAEFIHIESLFSELVRRTEKNGLETLTLVTPDATDSAAKTGLFDNYFEQSSHGGSEVADSNLQSFLGDLEPVSQAQSEISANELLSDVGISSYEFLSIVEQMSYVDDYGNMSGL